MDMVGGAASDIVRVRFWGVRGSIPTPGVGTNRYGGNTACVSVERGADASDLFVLDAGSGLRLLGLDMLREKRLPTRIQLFLTHTHWDHIQGFPFFPPAFIPGNEITVHGAAGSEEDLQAALAGQMLHRYFPVSLNQLGATIRFTTVAIGAQHIAGATVTTVRLHHPGVTVGYRLDLAGCSVAYVTDCEPRGSLPDFDVDPGVVELARDADVLIHDAQYADAEYPTKVGWGHSPIGYVVDLAVAAGAKRLFLFHHDPLRDDTQLDALVEEARTRAHAAGSSLIVDAAVEGTTVELTARVVKAAPPQLAAAG